MTSISSMETITPNDQPALPSSSPSSPADEDLGRRRIWEDGEELHSPKSPSSKGKRRERESPDSETEGTEEYELEVPDSGVYPPTNDEEAETRRVEENLRRWQQAEMQRRKSARESMTHTSQPSSSVMSDVGWRASSLWRKTSQRQRDLGKHVALNSEDSIEALPLDHVAASPGPSPVPSPIPSPLRSSMDNESENPFSNPPEAMSPFADSQQVTAVMSPSDPPPANSNPTLLTPTPERPTLLAKSSSFSRPAPPKPLDLPPPRTPPPPIDVPPHAVPPLSTNRVPEHHAEEQVKETRWWHEWLCGCGEDRDVDKQAGRTNPFE